MHQDQDREDRQEALQKYDELREIFKEIHDVHKWRRTWGIVAQIICVAAALLALGTACWELFAIHAG
jgi:hypothetical protein